MLEYILVGLFIIFVGLWATFPFWRTFVEDVSPIQSALDPNDVHGDVPTVPKGILNVPDNGLFDEVFEQPKDYAPPKPKKTSRLTTYQRAKIKKKAALERKKLKKN